MSGTPIHQGCAICIINTWDMIRADSGRKLSVLSGMRRPSVGGGLHLPRRLPRVRFAFGPLFLIIRADPFGVGKICAPTQFEHVVLGEFPVPGFAEYIHLGYPPAGEDHM
jgi:hypothetical protein